MESHVRDRTIRKPKMDFPVFSGRDPYEWLNKVEYYFYIFDVPNDERVSLASYYLNGRGGDG